MRTGEAAQDGIEKATAVRIRSARQRRKRIDRPPEDMGKPYTGRVGWR
jgi:hypothetical protein